MLAYAGHTVAAHHPLTDELVSPPPRSESTADRVITHLVSRSPPGAMAGAMLLGSFGLLFVVMGPALATIGDPVLIGVGAFTAVMGVLMCVGAAVPAWRARGDRALARVLARSAVAKPGRVTGVVDTEDGKYGMTVYGGPATVRRGWLLVLELDGGGGARVQLGGRRAVAGGEPAWLLVGDTNRALAWVPGMGAVVCELDAASSS